ncbi:MAG TPA: tetratricopeptide repeat protein [Clostridiaceae bacterium]|nr:tetratricopeptide repeat protein [Clostridiaceae bacterium]
MNDTYLNKDTSLPEEIISAIEEIESFLCSGKWLLAMENAAESLVSHPDTVELLWLHARAAEMGNQIGSALRDYAKLRRLLPEDMDLLYDQADLLLSLGYIEDSLRLIGRGEDREPHAVEWKVLKSLAYSKTGRLNDSLKLMEEVLDIRPDDPYLLTETAAILYLQGDTAGAAATVNRALDIEPRYSDAWCQLAMIQLSLGDMYSAEKSFKTAIQYNNQLLSAWIGLGQIYLCLDEPEKAKSCFRQVIMINPNDQEACQGMAAVYRSLGESSAESDWLERAAYSDQLD